MLMFFTAPVTGDVWLQDGQIKEEEEEGYFLRYTSFDGRVERLCR
jgi:hypothetical protein